MRTGANPRVVTEEYYQDKGALSHCILAILA